MNHAVVIMIIVDVRKNTSKIIKIKSERARGIIKIKLKNFQMK